MKKILNYLKILFINFILIAYLLELSLFLFLPDAQKGLVKIKETRLDIAKKLGLEYDLRTKAQAFYEIKQNNPNLSPSYYFNSDFVNYETFQKAVLSNKPIPFRGPINKQTLSCAEDLNYRLINNDKLGFKNPNYIYEKKIEIIIVGDSNAEGLCYDETSDISANLRNKEYNAANFGITGAGPLTSLGVFKEYVKKFKPNYVVYIYSEQNDIRDLLWEKNISLLKNYLKKDYTQNLFDRQDEIKIFLSDISEDIYKVIDATKFLNEKSDVVIIELLKDFLELTNLRNFVKNTFYHIRDEEFDEKLFFSIINVMNEETNSWNGKFIFVYTPSWARYFTKFTKLHRYFNKKDLILNNLEKNDITIIDLTTFFDQENDLTQYFPLGYAGHYNKKGYKKISNILISKIKEME